MLKTQNTSWKRNAESIGFANCKQVVILLQSWYMADTNDLLQQIRKVVREENEPIKNKLDVQGSSIARLEQGQAQTNTSLGQIKTLAEATAAGQKELQEIVATKADVLRVGVKVDSLRKRIEGIEEHTGSSTHKN